MLFIWALCRAVTAGPHGLTNGLNDPAHLARWVLWSVGRAVFCQSALALQPCGGLSKETLMAFKELRAITGWVIFILWGFGGGPKATRWRLSLSETGYWVSDGCQGTAV